MTTRVLMVCLGNICRSPTAASVMAQKVYARGLSDRIVVDSCGTADYHIGAPADARMVKAAAARGYDMSKHRARQLTLADFDKYDLILAADKSNVKDIATLRYSRPHPGMAQVRLFLDILYPGEGKAIPDPYYGGKEGFETVVDLCEQGARAWVEKLQ